MNDTHINPSEALIDAVKASDHSGFAKLLDEHPTCASVRNEQGLSLLMLCLYHHQPSLAGLVRDRLQTIDVYEAAAIGDDAQLDKTITTSPRLAREAGPDGFTPLHLACYFGRVSSVELLLGAHADVNAAATNGSELRPIHSAAAARSLEIVKHLLDAGADPNVQQHGGFTALMAAAMHGDEALIQSLIDSGAKSDSTNDQGQTAGDMARSKGVKDFGLP